MNSSETEKINRNERAARCGGWQPVPGMKADVEILQPVGDWSLRSFRDEAEIYAISYALKKTGWNRKRAAQLLRISYRGLCTRLGHTTSHRKASLSWNRCRQKATVEPDPCFPECADGWFCGCVSGTSGP